MHEIDVPTATVDHKFTNGNAANGTQSTTVDAAWLNAVQGELVAVIQAAGLTLVKNTNNQLLTAVTEIARRGGQAAPIEQALANNQASAADISSMPVWLSTQVRAIEFLFSAERKTDSSNKRTTGRGYITYNSVTQTWDVTVLSVHDDDVVALSVAATGNTNEWKLRYTTDNMIGTNYSGEIAITDIKKVLV